MKVVTYSQTSKKKKRSQYFKTKKEKAILDLFTRAISCTNGVQVDAAISLGYLLSSMGMNSRNYQLFFVLIKTNNPFVVDAVLGEREPALLFSNIKPHWYLLKETFNALAGFKRDEINEKTLLILLGIVQNAYKTSKYGYSIYPLNTSDIYNIGKFLNKELGQNYGIDRLILDILYDIYQVGIESRDERLKETAIIANRIRMAYFDDTKELMDVIPTVLLVTDPKAFEKINPFHYIT